MEVKGLPLRLDSSARLDEAIVSEQKRELFLQMISMCISTLWLVMVIRVGLCTHSLLCYTSAVQNDS